MSEIATRVTTLTQYIGGVHRAPSGKEVMISMAPNPSHLEAVNPVVAGIVRAKQDSEHNYVRVEQPLPQLGAHVAALDAMLADNAGKAQRDRQTYQRIFEELRALLSRRLRRRAPVCPVVG